MSLGKASRWRAWLVLALSTLAWVAFVSVTDNYEFLDEPFEISDDLTVPVG
jgi:hypothetical protein